MIKDFPKRRSFPCVKISVDFIFNSRQSCAAAVGEASLILYHCGEHFLLESCSEIKVSRALMPTVGTSRKNPEQQQSASKDVSTHGKVRPYAE